MILKGSVQLYPPNSVQSIPGSFCAGFNAKDVKLNQQLSNDAFAIPQ